MDDKPGLAAAGFGVGRWGMGALGGVGVFQKVEAPSAWFFLGAKSELVSKTKNNSK